MAEKQVKDYEKFVVRFPDGMRDAVAERAKRNGRSMNSEIISILENAIYCGDGDLHDLNPNEMHEVIKTQAGLLEKYEAALKNGAEALEAIKDLLSNQKPT